MGSVLLFFLAGLVTEALITGQTLAISRHRAGIAAGLSIVAWCLWGTILNQFVVNPLNVVPFAVGAGLGTYLAARKWRSE